ncbi:Collagen alpha-1 chain [Camelus dromedarius]|uniref:Collagen alpha-1 chain n=1 Tax=Camelus dromedarius TaxID=9838 RepID=A0A5N4C0D7_CAMDR|nr:Collagen alpha-1 chain [Camelus dromedarius]
MKKQNTRVTWKPAPGKVISYRVVYQPHGGRRQLVAKVPPTVTSAVLKQLQPQTTYDITVLPDYKREEGKLRQGSGMTVPAEMILHINGHLNAHRDKKSLLQAVANLPHKGGRTLTDMALNFICQQSFKTQAGMRRRARKIGVLITDDVEAPSKQLKDEGVELFAVGIKNADEAKLKDDCSRPR